MKDCKFCDKTGLLVQPLLYAVVVAYDSKALEALPKLPATLGAGVTDINLTQAKYAVRMLREGFLYVLTVREIEGKTIEGWTAYAITPDAFLYQFDAQTPPSGPIEFGCDQSTCGVNASCVAFPHVENVKTSYWLFTPHAMTMPKLAEYRKNKEGFTKDGKLQEFNPKAWAKAKAKSQPHSLKPDQLDEAVVEWQLYKQCKDALSSPLGLALTKHLFAANSSAYAGAPAPAPGKPQPGRLGQLQHQLEQQGGAAFVLFDAIGITQELNDFRNAPLEGVQHYLAATDEFGTSNMQRMQVHEAITELEAGMKGGVIHTTQSFLERHEQSSDLYFGRQLDQADALRKQGHVADADALEARVEESLRIRDENYAKALKESQASAQTDWLKKYASRLDTKEIDTFNKRLKDHFDRAFTVSADRAPQHLRWFESAQLIKAFDAYDPAHIPSGYNFAIESGMCTLGLSDNKGAQAKLDEWIKPETVDKKNIYLRGLFHNQTELIDAVAQANREISAAVSGEEFASDISPATMIRATKVLVDVFKKTDSAFDEWSRNQTQTFSQKWAGKGAKAGRELQAFHKVSELTRTVFRSGLGGTFDKHLTARLSGWLFAQLRAVSANIEYNDLMLTLPKAQVAAHRQRLRQRQGTGPVQSKQQRRTARLRAERQRIAAAQAGAAKIADQIGSSLETVVIDAQAKAKLKPTLAELRGSKNIPTNNYHQTRIGVLLGSIEMIALGEKLTHFESNTKGWLEVSGSVMAVGSIVLDTYYSAAKSIREIQPYKAINAIEKGADVVRGGFKIGAGFLGAGAGVCGAMLDWMKFDSEKDDVLKSLYGARAAIGFVGSVLTLVAAYSYTENLLKHLAKGYVETSKRRAVLAGLSSGARFLSTRVGLLVWIARFSWVGLAFTVVEIGYLYFKDDELQDWCDKCAFRKLKKEKNWLGAITTPEYFASAERELIALSEASKAVGH